MEKQKKCLITGAAGFIGSSLAEALIEKGFYVRGIDCFLKNYDEKTKKNNLKDLLKESRFEFIKGNLLTYDLTSLLESVDCVFHLAGLPGVRESWGKTFETYLENNVLATQRLLEAVKGKELKKFVFASSSSVYGDAESFPTSERILPRPISPYGVSKLSAEQLCLLYCKNFNVPVIALRYFTVYGPKQRPDLFFHKLIKSALNGEAIEIYGDGCQTRSYTYIDDVVNANILAMESAVSGEVFNIGGGARVSVNKVIDLVEKLTVKKIHKRYVDSKKGDARHTGACIKKARKLLGYYPKTRIKKGLQRQIDWHIKQQKRLNE